MKYIPCEHNIEFSKYLYSEVWNLRYLNILSGTVDAKQISRRFEEL